MSAKSVDFDAAFEATHLAQDADFDASSQRGGVIEATHLVKDADFDASSQLAGEMEATISPNIIDFDVFCLLV